MKDPKDWCKEKGWPPDDYINVEDIQRDALAAAVVVMDDALRSQLAWGADPPAIGKMIFALLTPRKPREVAVPEGLHLRDGGAQSIYGKSTDRLGPVKFRRTDRTDDQGRSIYEEVL